MLLIGLLVSLEAGAHPLDLGYLQIRVTDQRVLLTLELNPDAATEAHEKISTSIFANASLSLGQGDCRWLPSSTDHIGEQQIRIRVEAECVPSPLKSFRLDLPFLREAPSKFQILAKVLIGENEHSFVLDHNNREISILAPQAAENSFWDFVQMGIHHIGAAPSEWSGKNGLHLPDGIDHILFLLALILGGGGFWRILQTATGFTLGHSITLALGAMGWVSLPGRLVESAIALSIVYVALEAIFTKTSRGRWKVAAAFGLVHGFGFATALTQLELSRHAMLEALFGFNIGVEIGQAVIVTAVSPLVFLGERHTRGYRIVTRVLAGLIALAGLYWFVVRAFQLGR